MGSKEACFQQWYSRESVVEFYISEVLSKMHRGKKNTVYKKKRKGIVNRNGLGAPTHGSRG